MPDSQLVKVRAVQQDSTQTGVFSIEVEPAGGEVRVKADDYNFEDFTASLESLTSSLRATIQKVAPKKATVEFGIEVGVESGKLTALLVKGSGKANLKVTLEWS